MPWGVLASSLKKSWGDLQTSLGDPGKTLGALFADCLEGFLGESLAKSFGGSWPNPGGIPGRLPFEVRGGNVVKYLGQLGQMLGAFLGDRLGESGSLEIAFNVLARNGPKA